jgi:hypothetical protein
MTGGEVAGLAVPTAHVHITGLDLRDQPMKIDIGVNGPLRKTLELLDRPPLRFIRKVGLDPATVEGRVAASVSLAMMASVERPEDVDLHATAQLSDVALGHGLSAAQRSSALLARWSASRKPSAQVEVSRGLPARREFSRRQIGAAGWVQAVAERWVGSKRVRPSVKVITSAP